MDYEAEDSNKTPKAASKDEGGIKSRVPPAARRAKRSPTYPASASKMMINSMKPATKIQYPSAMQIESFGILDSSPSAGQFIISGSPPPPQPSLPSRQKEGTKKKSNEGKEICKNKVRENRLKIYVESG